MRKLKCGSDTSYHVCFMLLGHFIKHFVCIRGAKSKPTPPCEVCEEKWHQMANCCGLNGIYRGGALVAVGLANRD
jgi:hypothetical protein